MEKGKRQILEGMGNVLGLVTCKNGRFSCSVEAPSATGPTGRTPYRSGWKWQKAKDLYRGRGIEIKVET